VFDFTPTDHFQHQSQFVEIKIPNGYNLLYPRSPKGEGGILFYLCPSVLPSVQDIFRRIFLSNCWWQKSDIWSQASYRYTISWEAFLDPSVSYFLFADFVDFYIHWTYMLIFLKSVEDRVRHNKINCELMLTYDTPALRQTGSRNLTGPKTLPTIWDTYMKLVTKYQISAINSCWEKCDEKWAYMFNVYKNQQSRQNLVTSFI
jgi:hypothetical protein